MKNKSKLIYGCLMLGLAVSIPCISQLTIKQQPKFAEIEPTIEMKLITVEEQGILSMEQLTKETLDISYSEFRKKFAKEIQVAFESYRKTQLNKYSWNFKDDNSLEFNFYFELHWNFDHFGNSNWYIEKL